MLPVMVEKLATGRPVVQNHYRGELAAEEERVVVLIEDLIQRYGSSKNGALVIGNALGVIGLSKDPSAVRVARRMLGHPAESVRTAAIRSMFKLAEPEDYDLLQGLMPHVGGEVRRALVQAMGRADPERLAGDLSDWLVEDGEVALMVLAARSVAEAGAGSGLPPESLQLAASHHPNLRPFLAAARAAAGDSLALEVLRVLIEDESVLVRTRSLEAAVMAELNTNSTPTLKPELLTMAAGDPSENLRVLAVGGVSTLLPDDEVSACLRACARDNSEQVRQACLAALLNSGDEAVRGIFLEMIHGGPSELGPALRAVRGAWGKQPGLADRAADELVGILDLMTARPLKEREPWVQALGQVPSAEASAWLLERAKAEQGERHHMTAHRWLVLQVSNGGSAGRGLLMESWRNEADPQMKLDYLWGASLSREPDTVAFLIEVVLSEGALDHERLFSADCLTRQGDTQRIAPILKRACLAVTDPEVRPAFEELLWLWYS
jgi:HEAT repeat protein